MRVRAFASSFSHEIVDKQEEDLSSNMSGTPRCGVDGRARRYGTGSGSDRAPAERALRRAPGCYRSRYRTNVTWFDLVDHHEAPRTVIKWMYGFIERG